MLTDREEISRGLAELLEYKEIAAWSGRDRSVVSREVNRFGGRVRYRAVVADAAAVGPLRARPGEWAVVLETESRGHAELSIHALTGRRHLWPAVRSRDGLLTIYACWSTTKPEATTSSATVYEFPSAGEHSREPSGERSGGPLADRDTEHSDEIDDEIDEEITEVAEMPSASRRRRWWRR